MKEDKKNLKILKTKTQKSKIVNSKDILSIKNLNELNSRYLSSWKKSEANFLNYKKEEESRVSEYIKLEQEKFVLKLLNILDNLLLAEAYTPDNLKENDWILGIMQIKSLIIKFLESYDAHNIETIGKKVDFKFHEVLQEIETSKEKSGIIIKEVQKGYIMNGKVIRAAKVIITK